MAAPKAPPIEYNVEDEVAARETWFAHIDELNRHADIAKQNKKLGRETELRTIAKQFAALKRTVEKHAGTGKGDYL